MKGKYSAPNKAWGSTSEKYRNKTVDARQFGKYLAKMQEGDSISFQKAVRAQHARSLWEKIAPEEVLDHTERVYLLKIEDKKSRKSKTVVKIYVDDSAWAADLDAQKEQYRFFLEQKLNEGHLDEVIFKTSSKIIRDRAFHKHITQVPAYKEEVPSVALSAEEEKCLEDSTAVIGDEDLREALKSARRRDQEWKKGISALKSR